jgi:hypothetical protein
MEKITRENYEIIFIDYIDRNLSQSMKDQLDLFLIENPDLKLELEGYEQSSLAPVENDKYEQKNHLKKIEANNLDEQIAAYIEGDLNKSQRQILETLAKEQPALEKDILMMSKIKLTPSVAEFYAHKEHLKKFSISWPVNVENVDLFLAANLEGDLTEVKKKELKKFTADHPEFLLEEKNYSKTKLKAESELKFEQKSSLYRSGKKGILIHFKRAIAIAAMFIISFGIYKFYNSNDDLPSIASNKKIQFLSPKEDVNAPIINPQIDSNKTILIKENKPEILYKKQIEILENDVSSNVALNERKLEKKNKKKKEIETKPIQQPQDLKNKLETKQDTLPLPNKNEPVFEEPINVGPLSIEQFDVAEERELSKNIDEKIYSLREFLEQKIKEKIFTKSESEKSKEIRVDNGLAYSIGKATGIEVDYKKEIKPKEECLSLSIGSFEFSRKKSGR